MKILYTPSFIRKYKKLQPQLQEEVKEKIEFFKKNPKQPSLRIHKLKEPLKGAMSFSVNFAYRIIFLYKNKNTAKLLEIGTHEIYSR